MDRASEESVSRTALKVGVATLSRLVLNTARRLAYPFAPVFSRGLGVPLTAVTSAIAVNQATGILGILLGPVADRIGYRFMMLAGLAALGLGMFMGGLFPIYGIFLFALFLAGLGKSVFDPAIQAYVGNRVSYHRRGLVIGLLEFAWAGSALVGIPLIGLLIDRLGWRSPFWVIGGMAVLCMAAVGLAINKGAGRADSVHRPVGFREAWNHLLRSRPAMGALGLAFFMSMANDNLFVVYGAWLEKAFSLSVISIGFGTGAIGIAEFLGECLTAAFADRLGLRRAVRAGLILSAFSYALLPLTSGSLVLALFGLFMIFLTFEFSVVTFMSICTELLPDVRATMMSGFFAAAGVGRVLGALMGGPLWLWGGIEATALVSAVLTVFSLGLLRWGLRDWTR